MPILSPDHQTHCRDFRHVHLLASTNNNPPISLSTYSQIHNYTIIYPYIFKFFVFKFISLFLGFKHFCVLPFLSILVCEVRPSVRSELRMYSKTCTFAASLNLFVCLHKLQHKSRKWNLVPTIYIYLVLLQMWSQQLLYYINILYTYYNYITDIATYVCSI